MYNCRFVATRVTDDVPSVSGVIDCDSKMKKLGNEPPPGAAITETIRRYSPDPNKVGSDTIKFLTPPEVKKPRKLKKKS